MANEWIDYKGERDKKEYDIQLYDGTVLTNYYPNAYTWHRMVNNKYKQKYHDNEVIRIRLSERSSYDIYCDEMDKRHAETITIRQHSSHNDEHSVFKEHKLCALPECNSHVYRYNFRCCSIEHEIKLRQIK